ncbi:MAG: hypothetical protein KME29_19985 [Calothrix sp. FI2-JRJ7]|jgi:hypothetical protein|nr:hypothetical protein [Calothrix sp. FI2-JRJ7]
MKIILNKSYALTSYMLLALMSGCSISQLSAAPQATQSDAAKKVDRATNTQIQQYIKSLAAQGFPKPEGKLASLNEKKDASGKNLEYFRTQQDNLLQSFVQKWGAVKDQPTQLKPNPTRNTKTSYSEIVK